MGQVSVRPAAAGDVEQVVELIYSSGPELLDYMFTAQGKSAQDFIRYEFSQGGGFMGHCIHKVAVDGDVVKGIGAFYTGQQYSCLSMQSARNILKFYGLVSGSKTLLRASHSESVMMRPKKKELYIADLGVAAHSRSEGIGSVLIDYHKQEAAQRGLHSLVLDVAMINPRAEALYSRLGFNVVNEQAFQGGKNSGAVPGTRRMVYSLK